MSNAVTMVRSCFMALYLLFRMTFHAAVLSLNSIAGVLDGHPDHHAGRRLLDSATIPRTGDENAGYLVAVRHNHHRIGAHFGRCLAQLRFNLLHADTVAGRLRPDLAQSYIGAGWRRAQNLDLRRRRWRVRRATDILQGGHGDGSAAGHGHESDQHRKQTENTAWRFHKFI